MLCPNVVQNIHRTCFKEWQKQYVQAGRVYADGLSGNHIEEGDDNDAVVAAAQTLSAVTCVFKVGMGVFKSFFFSFFFFWSWQICIWSL